MTKKLLANHTLPAREGEGAPARLDGGGLPTIKELVGDVKDVIADGRNMLKNTKT
jgi:hypothetical protein